ncbi:MAG: carbonate dehydratase [Candidatus Cloacimonadota bacterium]|nr:MAG: carbonate dehydratase [Candidatus Cloacimonadota bacterium]
MKQLENLFIRNKEWANSVTKKNPDFFSELSKQQTPKYLWIGCSDSRVPENQIMGLVPGDIFVHRNIANVVAHSDLNCLSVIQYAIEALNIENIIVCGHYGCGGVKACLGSDDNGFIGNWLQNIDDVRRLHKESLNNLNDEDKINLLCELNVQEQVINVCKTTIVQDAWNQGINLSVHGLIYDINDGILKNLDSSISSKAELSLKTS